MLNIHTNKQERVSSRFGYIYHKNPINLIALSKNSKNTNSLKTICAAIKRNKKMPYRMLIDANHDEETRVIVLNKEGKIEEFDIEAKDRNQIRGNIYLAKVTRVEPSLQAAFVEYGGNRHGFLAFNEIHPDYYQIPTSERKKLLDEETELVTNTDASDDIDEPESDEAEVL